jgi:hypothetical protein
MVGVPCPWCEAEVALADLASPEASLHCDACATVVDLAPEPVAPTVTLLAA